MAAMEELHWCEMPGCSLTFESPQALEEHVATAHQLMTLPDPKPATTQLVQRAIRGGPYHCLQCPAVYASRWSMYSHRKQTQHPFEMRCPQCDFRTQNGHLFGQHTRAHAPKHYAGSDQRRDPNRPFTCAICGEGFAAPRGLLVHHEGCSTGGGYTCRGCEQHFPTWADLLQHVLATH